MNPLPEIAPEVRGLLEEIVADPRSSIRLVPRRPLRQWFDAGESMRTADIAWTRAERHLIDEHREALAKLLHDAAVIAYWKAPVLAHRPVKSGAVSDPAEGESEWKSSATRHLALSRGDSPEVELLKECLNGIRPESGHSLAQASLALIPCESTRYCVAASVPWMEPWTAVALLSRLSSRRNGDALRAEILLSLGARLCGTGLYREARNAYRACGTIQAREIVARCYAFNLSCLLMEEKEALAEAATLGRVAGEDHVEITQASSILQGWARQKQSRALANARSLATRISRVVPPSAARLCGALLP